MQRLFLLLAFVLAFATGAEAQTIVQRHGQLKVVGNKIKDECDRNVQLRGMSFFWSQWEGKEYYNGNVVKWLRDDWKAQIVRAALAVRGGTDDYIAKPTENKNRIKAVVDGAIQHGIYVIIDWHAHPNYQSQAVDFFREMAQTYKDNPNVVYEIWNEPIGDYGYSNALNYWNSELKPYSEAVIAAIRDHDPDNIIIVPTPFYAQYLDAATSNPITQDSKGRSVSNIAYNLHFYAGQHKASVRAQAQTALDRGYAVWATECSPLGTQWGPGNSKDEASWNEWESWMDNNKVSWSRWSLSNKNERSSHLQTSASTSGNWDVNNDLTDEGRWTRSKIRSKNTFPSVCSGGGNDEIASITAPASVQQGQTVTVPVNYSATTNRDIVVLFQLDASPWTGYVSKKVDVSAGSGTVNVSLTIPSSTPIANDAYQFQVYLTTNGGGWNQRLSNKRRNNVDVTAPASSTSNHNIYTDNLKNSWANWSWGGTATVQDGGVKKYGSYSFKYQYNNGGAVSFRHPNGRSGDDLLRLEFWARVWTGSTTFKVSASYDDNYANRSADQNRTVTTTWQKFTLTKAQMNNYGWYKRIFIEHGSTGNTIFLDNVRLVYSGSSLDRPDEEIYVDLTADDPFAGRPDAAVFPNPNRGSFTLELSLPDGAADLTLDLLDVNGRVVDRLRQSAATGTSRLALDFRGKYAPGLHYLRVTDATGAVNLTRRVMLR